MDVCGADRPCKLRRNFCPFTIWPPWASRSTDGEYAGWVWKPTLARSGPSRAPDASRTAQGHCEPGTPWDWKQAAGRSGMAAGVAAPLAGVACAPSAKTALTRAPRSFWGPAYGIDGFAPLRFGSRRSDPSWADRSSHG